MKSPWARIVLGIVGVIGIVVGVMKFSQEMKEIFGGDDMAEIQKRAAAGDALIAEGNKLSAQASESNDLLWPKVDEVGFPAGRDQVTPEAKRISDLYKQAADKFSAAAKEYTAGKDLSSQKELKEFLEVNTQACNKLVEINQQSAARVELLLDDKITNVDDLVAKITTLGEKISADLTQFKTLEEQVVKQTEEIKKKAK